METTTIFGKIHKAGFYYKGQGLVIGQDQFQIEGLLDVFEKSIPDYLIDIKDNGVGVYLDQLDQIKRHVDKKNLFDDEDMTIVWMMNIYILTKLGFITNDDNNGTQFIYFNK